MKYANLVRQLLANALFWVGAVGIVFTLVAGDYSLALLFVALVVLNFALLFFLRIVAPNAFKQAVNYVEGNATPQKAGAVGSKNIGFRIYPLQYPKVVDADTRDYVPELIHVDIQTDQGLVFNGNFNRDALKNFRDSLTNVLQASAATLQPPSPVTTVTPASVAATPAPTINAKPAAKKRAARKKK